MATITMSGHNPFAAAQRQMVITTATLRGFNFVNLSRANDTNADPNKKYANRSPPSLEKRMVDAQSD
jgi:hypothetical protein